MVTLTNEELETFTPEQRAAHYIDEEKTVFGRTAANDPAFKKVNGVPQELGIGSPGRENGNHFSAILKYEGQEAYQDAVDKLWKHNPEHAKRLNLPKRRVA